MKKHVFNRRGPLFSKDGSALLVTIFISALVMFGLYNAFNWFPVLFSQMSRSDKLVAYGMVLESSKAYLKYSIKTLQHWDSKGMAILPPQDIKDMRDNAKAGNYLARLTFGDRYVASPDTGLIAQYNKLTAGNLPLNDKSFYLGEQGPWSITIPFSDQGIFAPGHPLKVLEDLAPREKDSLQSPIESITFSAKRVHSPDFPSDGRTTFLLLKVVVNLTGAAGMLGRGVQPEAEELVAFGPRTWDTYALVVAGNIVLNKGKNDSVGPADFKIPLLKNSNDLDKGSNGFVFMSPVYAGNGVVLPDFPTPMNPSPGYNATTFSAPVTFGSGRLWFRSKNGTLMAWKPSSAGAADGQPFSELSTQMGGFQNGIQRDGTTDRGLRVAMGLEAKEPVNDALMNKCLAKSQAVMDLTKTAGSGLLIKTPGDGGQEQIKPGSGPPYSLPSERFSYTVGFSGENTFVDQGSLPVSVRDCREYDGGNLKQDCGYKYVNKDSVRVAADKDHKASVMNVTIGLYEPPGNTNKLVGQINADLSRVSVLDVTLNDLYVEGFEASYDKAKGVTSSAKSALDALDKASPDYAKAESDYNAAKAAEDTANNDLGKAKSDTPGAPRITVSTSNIKVKGDNQPDQIYFRVSTANEKGFHYSAVPRIRIVGYDPAYNGSENTRDANANNNLSDDPNKLASPVVAIQYTSNSSGLVAPSNITGSWSTASPDPSVAKTLSNPPDGIMGETIAKCSSQSDSSGGAAAFPPPAVTEDFSGDTWKVLDYNPRAEFVWTSSNAGLQPSAVALGEGIPAFSFVGTCRITASAKLVVGLMNCRKLIIEPRSQKLRMIGTWFVQQADIADSAIKAGIQLSSIFHPQAAYELEQAGWLGAGLPANHKCKQVTDTFPIWHPELPMSVATMIYSCSVNSLRVADQFTKSYTYDCGLPRGNPTAGIRCHGRDLNFITSTISSVSNVIQ